MMRRFRFFLVFAVALLLLSAAVRPQAAAAQTACDPNAPVQLVSIGVDGVPVNSDLLVSMTPDGRYIAFQNVIEGDVWSTVTRSEFILRDRLTCQSEIVSLNSDETRFDWVAGTPQLSGDARHVAFMAGFTGSRIWQIYQRDRWTGETRLVSLTPTGAAFQCGGYVNHMSADGRYIIFEGNNAEHCSDAPPVGAVQIYVRDTLLNSTELVTVATNGQPSASGGAVGYPSGKAISDDGRLVFFTSGAVDLVVGDSNNARDMFMRDRVLGATTLVSRAIDGGWANGNTFGFSSTLTPDSRYFLFDSSASNLTLDDPNGVGDAFVFDLQNDVIERIPLIIGGMDAGSIATAISSDARYFIQFPPYPNNHHFYIHDRHTGALFDVPDHPHANPTGAVGTYAQSLSADGRFILYALRRLGANFTTWTDVYVAEWQRLTPGVIAPPAPPQPITPINLTFTNTQQLNFAWNRVWGATWYYLWVTGADGHVFDQWYHDPNGSQGSIVSVFLPPLNLPPGQYQWWVQAWSPYSGYGEWNSGAFFTVNVPPAAPSLTAPTGIIAENQPTYTWNAVPGAAWYYLWVSDESGYVLDQWYDGYNICAGGACSVTPAVTLEGGAHSVWLQAWSPYGGYSAWSPAFTFGVPPAAPTPLAPVGTNEAEVAFQWTRGSGGSWYYVWLSDANGKVFDTWFDAATFCAEATCATDLLPLPPGEYRWWVQAWGDAGGYGAWSAETPFTIPTPPL